MASVNHSNLLSLEHHQRLKQAIRRDVVFLIAGIIAYAIVAYVETHAADAEIRGNIIPSFTTEDHVCHAVEPSQSLDQDKAMLEHCTNKVRILDAGFILTTPIHRYLSQHRDVNDQLAMLNSMLLTIPLAYVIYITVWKGDFTLSFRLISTHLFRSLCGWFTYLPPDPAFLMSYYDFPEVFLCLFHHDCTTVSEAPSYVPFVTFFSGHIATIVIIANHLYTRKYTQLSIALHTFNWLQALRLLATRGHYSIDLIIGYVVAVFVSSPAEKLGWYFSQSVTPALPQNAMETFEILVGVRVTDDRNNGLVVQKENADGVCNDLKSDLTTCLKEHIIDNDVQSETSVRVALEIVSGLASVRR